MNKSKKILILGNGIAGTFLAATLCRSGHRVSLAGDSDPRSASQNAAGLFNVITGRKSVKTWKADALLDSLNDFFEIPEFKPLGRHLNRMEIYRPFHEMESYNTWALQSDHPFFAHLCAFYPEPRNPDQVHNAIGGLGITACGWLETSSFLKETIELLTAQFDFKHILGKFDYKTIDPQDCTWEGEKYDEIVCTEGIRALYNPWFSPFLDLIPLKGQIVEVEVPGFEPNYILSRKVFMIPRGNGHFTCGSTYERHFEDEFPSPAGIEEISSNLKVLLKIPFQIHNARASIRPTTPNRRPIIGTHPEFPHLHILNGLGTKGVIQAPWCAQQMNKYLSGEVVEIGKELSFKRFLKEFS